LPPGINYFFVDYIIVVRRIVKFMKWNKFSIIGHSMGAGVGAFYASVFPSDIEQLVLLDLVKPLTGDQHGYAENIRKAIGAALALEEKLNPVPPTYDYFEALDRLRKATSNSLTEEAAKILLLRGSRQVDEEKYCFTRDLRLRNPSLNRFSHEDSYDILSNIRCRILLLKAKEGPDFENTNVIERVMEIYRKKASEFEFIEVGGNHFFHLNQPEESANHINRFFLKQKAAL
jgi:pimeloyl-ACP methyl ester carboxylesterase